MTLHNLWKGVSGGLGMRMMHFLSLTSLALVLLSTLSILFFFRGLVWLVGWSDGWLLPL